MNRTHRDAPSRRGADDSRGFSLVELMVALAVTLTIMAVAGRMLSMTMNVRTRENQRTEAIADVQRALQSMSREIANAGLGLSSNGITSDVPDETTFGEIRIRSNLNGLPPVNDTTTKDAGEDVVYTLINDATVDPPQRLITRQDVNSKTISQVANRIDALQFTFLKADGTAATPSTAERVQINVSVTLPAVGTAGSAGYQPATVMRLQSDVILRNTLLTK
ncbi:MAG: prepilin-type N-terminal cleavage/methylation domain-containing protein [Acidobacteria bacterium]|nr:prepilin-type N-terminal cleavage/methylation domain-containing protein [Acidobacteriota bacterium]